MKAKDRAKIIAKTHCGHPEWCIDCSDEMVAAITKAIREAEHAEREACATKALEQRCQRGTPWDGACVVIAKAIRENGGCDE